MIVRVDHLVPIEMNCGEVLDWDESWSIVILTDSKEYRTFCSKDSRGAYTLRISREMVDWKMAVGDFISYAKANQKNAILVMKDEELKEAKRYYDGHAFNEVYLRIGEPEILVHSTTLENWSMICCDGCLLSWNAIRYAGRGLEKEPIGKLLGDPEDFRDYIMFGSGVACECIVASKQTGRLIMDPEQPYQSGARLYFDARRMAEEGLLIRDGAHIKVKDSLPLIPYLLWTATWKELGLPDRVTTPRVFSQMADKVFETEIMHAKGIYASC